MDELQGIILPVHDHFSFGERSAQVGAPVVAAELKNALSDGAIGA